MLVNEMRVHATLWMEYLPMFTDFCYSFVERLNEIFSLYFVDKIGLCDAVRKE